LALENVFAARVEEEIFKGAADRLTLVTASGTRLNAMAVNASALGEAIHAGDRVWCAVHHDDIVVIR
jgi:spermidine/putrescine transport system ATP-binding protein